MQQANSSFSKINPYLQLAVDSTSLGSFKTCQRQYLYSIIWGYQSKQLSVDLIFGLLMHGGVERYHHSRAAGKSHDEAVQTAVHWVLKETWDSELRRPAAAMAQDSYKNRFTLLRTLVWYLDQYGENDAVQTVVLANGKPAVELSFSFDAGLLSSTGEQFLLCGHLDRLGTLNEVPYVLDVKTSKSELSPRYWAGHNPSNQFGIYNLAGQVVWNLPTKGLIVDAAQVLVNSSRFDRHLIAKDESQTQEFYQMTLSWLGQMDRSAQEAARLDRSEGAVELAYPMNETSCTKYSGCIFQGVCSKSPASRRTWLEAQFGKRVWDPLQRRGDI